MKRVSWWGLLFFLCFMSFFPLVPLWAEEAPRFMLQTAAFPTPIAARQELERLKAHGVMARTLIKEDLRGNKWYAVYIDLFASREEAAREGNRLLNKGIIRNFFIFPYPGGEGARQEREVSEVASPKEIDGAVPSLKKTRASADKGSLAIGPIVIKEEASHILMTIGLSRRILPKVRTQKGEMNSRLFVTFPPADKVLVPIEFRRDSKQALQSFSVNPAKADLTFVLVLNPSYNYEVSQNYFDREKRFVLKIHWEAAGAEERAKE